MFGYVNRCTVIPKCDFNCSGVETIVKLFKNQILSQNSNSKVHWSGSLISYHLKNTPLWLTFLVYDWAFTYAFVNLKCMAILKIWTTKQNKKYGDYDVTLLLNTPRGTRWRHRPSSSVKPKTDEEAKERREGWHDIYVQGRPHWDGTGNANYYWWDVPVAHLSISHH